MLLHLFGSFYTGFCVCVVCVYFFLPKLMLNDSSPPPTPKKATDPWQVGVVPQAHFPEDYPSITPCLFLINGYILHGYISCLCRKKASREKSITFWITRDTFGGLNWITAYWIAVKDEGGAISSRLILIFPVCFEAAFDNPLRRVFSEL